MHSHTEISLQLPSQLKDFLNSKGIATSWTTSYNNPWENEPVEKLKKNKTLWRSAQLAFKSKQLSPSVWEVVLPDALHSI